MAEIWESWGHYAYLGAFIWAFFEGETFVLAAAALGAATGAVDPWLLFFSVWFGSFLGDQTWFTLGRRYGPRIVRRIKGADQKVARVNDLLHRYGTWFILSFRFLYGIRNVASAACGLAGLNWARFRRINGVLPIAPDRPSTMFCMPAIETTAPFALPVTSYAGPDRTAAQASENSCLFFAIGKWHCS